MPTTHNFPLDGFAFCSVATPMRIGYTTTLMVDLAAHHPDSSIFLLQVGGERSWAGREPLPSTVTILSLSEIGITPATIGQLRASSVSDEEYLLTLQPWLLRAVLDQGSTAAMFVADDVHVVGSLEPVAARAASTGAAFLRRSPALQASTATTLWRGDDEPSIDPDLLCVGASGKGFLERWQAASLQRAMGEGPGISEFLDRAPDEFPDSIISEPGFNVGWWNLNLVAGVASLGPRALPPSISALHLHGFDARRPHLLTTATLPHLPALLSERPGLASMCRDYARRVLESSPAAMWGGWASHADLEAGAGALATTLWAEEVGMDRFAAACWERARERAAIGRCPPPPEPRDDNRTEWTRWLQSPPEGSRLPVGRYLMEVYRSRPDLQVAFPDLVHEPGALWGWAKTYGRRELGIPDELLVDPEATLAGAEPPALRDRAGGDSGPTLGVNVVGLMGEHLGLGEAARQLLSALQVAGVPFRTLEVASSGGSRLRQPALSGPEAPWFPINIVCLNPPELQGYRERVGRRLWDGRYTVGIWVWETETIPYSWRQAADLVDEIWVPSEYVRRALSPAVTVPIYTVPHAVPAPSHPRYMDRQYLGLPDRYTFLFLFDFFSSIQRKNPLGLVRAFQQAFAPGEGPQLVIKTIHGHRHRADFEELLLAVNGRDDILLCDRVLTSDERAALLDASDCYVSLHRAEGFGLTLAESMALGKPVVATGYSGNLEYMTPENSYLVKYSRTRVGVDWDRYPADHVWADPDLVDAASVLREVWSDPGTARDRAARAQVEIASSCSPEVVGALVRQRLEEVWSGHRRRDGDRRSLARRSAGRLRLAAGRFRRMPRSG